MKMMMEKKVEIRRVWQHNLALEFALIQSIMPLYPIISLDTEFPGTVFQPNKNHSLSQTPAHKYQLMKANVDAMKIIQLGLTLSDPDGNLPDLGTHSCCYIWEFNFRDFDIDHDLQNRDSIDLLKRQGINFLQNREMGICSLDFSRLILTTGLVFNGSLLTWVTFHSAYDFGFLVKILSQRQLPEDIGEFMRLVGLFFGPRVYDIKYMMRFCEGLYGGLERVARTLEVDRAAGKSHQAGSDSLLTLQTFMRLKDVYFRGDNRGIKNCNLNGFQGVLYGLEVEAH